MTTAPAPAPPAAAPAMPAITPPAAPAIIPPAAIPAIAAAPALLPAVRKFTVAEYYRLAAAGILRPAERVELIKGEIIVMAPIGIRHAGEVDRLARVFYRQAHDRFLVRVQNPIRLEENSEPEPDLALLRFRADEYFAGHPAPEDTLLVVEVADTTLAYDREVKAKLYAAAGIPQMLIMDLNGDCIEDLTDPGPDGYRRRLIRRRGENLRLIALPDLAFAVADLLPPRPAGE